MHAKFKINADGTAVYRIQVYGCKDLDGTRPRKRETFVTKSKTPAKQEAEVKAEELRFANMFKGISAIDTREMSFRDYARQWENSTSYKNLTQSVQEEIKGIQERRLFPYLGKMKVADITPANIRQIVEMESKTLSPKSVRKTITSANYIFNLAMEDGVIESNPTVKVKLPKLEEKTGIHFFDLDQAQKFLNVVSEYGPMWESYFYLAILSGARRGELVALKWDDLNYEEHSIRIEKAVSIIKASREKKSEDEPNVIVKDPKTHAGTREFELPEVCFEVLKRWRKEQSKLASNWSDYQGYIFTTDTGARMYPTSPTAKFKKILNKYNETAETKLPDIHLHELRHSCATILQSKNVDIETLAHRLGHADPSVLLNIYAHPTNEADKRASDTLESLFGERKAE